MISFDPKISLEIGSIASILSSIFCAIVFYYWYTKTKSRSEEMATKIENLSDAFIKITDVLMRDSDDTKDDDNIPIPDNGRANPYGWLRDTREAEAIQKDN